MIMPHGIDRRRSIVNGACEGNGGDQGQRLHFTVPVVTSENGIIVSRAMLSHLTQPRWGQ